jgi:hypothetical protein
VNKKLVKFKLEDGSSVVFETDMPEENTNNGATPISKGSRHETQQADERFESVAKRIRPAAQLVLDSLRELNSPKEISLEFGLKFSAKTGVIVASADSEVNFKVHVKWVNDN